jgi:hypothetical protein
VISVVSTPLGGAFVDAADVVGPGCSLGPAVGAGDEQPSGGLDVGSAGAGDLVSPGGKLTWMGGSSRDVISNGGRWSRE